MMKSRLTLCVLGFGLLLGPASYGEAAVIGRPVEFDITIMQGGNLVAQALNVAVSGADPLDGNNFMKIGDLSGMTSVYVSVAMTDPTAEESVFGFTVRAAEAGNPLMPGVDPLFDTSGSGDINVYIENLRFMQSGLYTDVTMTHFGSPYGDTAAALHFMAAGGWYYRLPDNEYWLSGGKHTYQVPFTEFDDPNTGVYESAADTGTSIDFAWQNVPSPVDTTYNVTNSDTNATILDPTGGEVFQMGLGTYVWGNAIPEPGTIGLLMLGGVVGLARRRRAC